MKPEDNIKLIFDEYNIKLQKKVLLKYRFLERIQFFEDNASMLTIHVKVPDDNNQIPWFYARSEH